MTIEQTNENGVLLLSIRGDLDASNTIALDEAFEKAFDNQQYHITVECDQLNYISSAGVGVFISHLDSIAQNNGELALRNLTPNVYAVFEMLSLHKLIKIYSTKNQPQ